MKTFRWILLSLFSLSFVWAQAQNQDQLVLRTHEVAQGKKWNLEVAFENPVGENYTAFQMDLSLPTVHHLYSLFPGRRAADQPGHYRGICGKNLPGNQGPSPIYHRRDHRLPCFRSGAI